jgi:hypothetical protein
MENSLSQKDKNELFEVVKNLNNATESILFNILKVSQCENQDQDQDHEALKRFIQESIINKKHDEPSIQPIPDFFKTLVNDDQHIYNMPMDQFPLLQRKKNDNVKYQQEENNLLQLIQEHINQQSKLQNQQEQQRQERVRQQEQRKQQEQQRLEQEQQRQQEQRRQQEQQRLEQEQQRNLQEPRHKEENPIEEHKLNNFEEHNLSNFEGGYITNNIDLCNIM